MSIASSMIDLVERAWVPDAVTRIGIRSLLKKRLANVDQRDCESNQARLEQIIKQLSTGPIAILPEKANEQHYEVPADLFRLTLGRRRKYSCCWWPDGVNSLDDAEEKSLEETCRRAEIEDGMSVLELGCGWGSLTLWLAEKYPLAKITAVSNSRSQREFILNAAETKGIGRNLTVLTCDMNEFETEQQFDRVVSIEMFEHMRNYRLLLQKISNWLRPEGKLFVHIFCHREFTYEFQDEGDQDWMSRHFFSGGIMPSDDLLTRFQDDLLLAKRWRWSGCHYQKTCESWLANMDANREPIMQILASTYGPTEALRWFSRWRMFYLACSELFGFNSGHEWWVGHFQFEKRN